MPDLTNMQKYVNSKKQMERLNRAPKERSCEAQDFSILSSQLRHMK